MSSPEFSVVNVKPFKRVIGVNGKKAWLSYMKKGLKWLQLGNGWEMEKLIYTYFKKIEFQVCF